MEINKIDWLKRCLRDSVQNKKFINAGFYNINVNDDRIDIIIKNLKKNIHELQDTQLRWNIRKEKRKLQNLIKDSEDKKTKRRL